MPFDPMRPFTRAQAIAAGITDRQLRGPRYVQLLGGYYISSSVPDLSLERTRAALLVHPPGAVATHFSSARLRKVPISSDAVEHVTVARADDRRHRHGLRCHVAAIAAEQVEVVDGIRISAPLQMFVELASALPLVELVVVGDWLVRHGWTSCQQLVEFCTTTHQRHAKRARQAASHVRERVDSPMETRLRMLLVLAGLPEPQVNLRIRGEDGAVLLRFDLSYPRLKVAVEYDGRHHLEDPAQWERDVERRDDTDGWRVVTVTSKGIYREPERTIARVARALRERGLRPAPALRDDWRAHFGR
jgi:very-short-patch-repair endonuclease